MNLMLHARDTERIHAHLRDAYPEEGCGVLIGREQGAVREIERIIVSENRREESRHNRYLIAPEQFLAADREARAAGLDVLGFFHSHPDHPPRPSAFDLEHAWPYYSYMIVSLERGHVVETRSWRLSSDRTRFDPEDLVFVPDAAASAHVGDRP